MSTSAALTVRTNRTRIDAYETQPPLIARPATRVTTSRSMSGLKMPTKTANGAAMSSRLPMSSSVRPPSDASTMGKSANGSSGSTLYLPNDTTHTMKTSVVTTFARGSRRCTGVSAPAAWSRRPSS
jgi:hypothetical protein